MNIDTAAPASQPAASRSPSAPPGSGGGSSFADALTAAAPAPAARGRRDGGEGRPDRGPSAGERPANEDDAGAATGATDRPNRGTGHAHGQTHGPGQGRGGIHGRAMALAQARAQADARLRRTEAAAAAAASKAAGGEPPADAARIEAGQLRESASRTEVAAPAGTTPAGPSGSPPADGRTTLAAVDARTGPAGTIGQAPADVSAEAGIDGAVVGTDADVAADTTRPIHSGGPMNAAGTAGAARMSDPASTTGTSPSTGAVAADGRSALRSELSGLDAATGDTARSSAMPSAASGDAAAVDAGNAGRPVAGDAGGMPLPTGSLLPAASSRDARVGSEADVAPAADGNGAALSTEQASEQAAERPADVRTAADARSGRSLQRLEAQGVDARAGAVPDTASRRSGASDLPIDPELAASTQAALAAAAAGTASQPGAPAARSTGARTPGPAGTGGVRATDAADGRTTSAADPARGGTLPVSLDSDELARAIGDRLRQASPERGIDTPAPPAGSFAASLQAAGQSAGTPAQGNAQASAPAPDPSYPITVPFSDPRFGEALSERVTWLVREGLQTAELTLHPKELGPIRIELALDGDSASIGFSATQADTRAAIEQALPKLRDMLAGQGLQLGGALIDAGSGQKGNGDAPRARAGRGDPREPSGAPLAAAGLAPAPRAMPSGRVDVFA